MGADVIERQSGLAVVEFSPPMRAYGLTFRKVDGEDGPEGVGEVMVAVFDIPDTAPAVGNMVRQKIDKGAFRSWIGSMDWTQQTVMFLRDHGNAHLSGHVDSGLILGYGKDYREETATVRGDRLTGLVVEEHWNLNTFEGREAFERARFDPYGTQFSFRWTKDETYRGKDGFEHVSEFSDVVESSQVGLGAQAMAGVLADSLRGMVDEAVEKKVQVVVSGLAHREPEVQTMEDQEPQARHAFHGDKVPRKPSNSLLKEWLKDDDFRDKVKKLIDGKGADESEDGMRAFSLDTLRYRIGSAAEQMFREGGCYAFCVDVVADDASFASGWVVVGMWGSYVMDESDPEDVKALGGADMGGDPVWYRLPFTGVEPDVNDVPSRFEFDPTGALEVEQRWVDAGTPLRSGQELIGDLVSVDWLESTTAFPSPTAGLAKESAPAEEKDADQEWAQMFAETDWYEEAFGEPSS